jgi:predicted SAM-dependent methyltransferase
MVMHTKEKYRIDIGCGSPEQRYGKNFIGIDINPDYHPDILHDVEKGIPFKDKSVVFINSDNSLEHTKNPYYVLQEMYRVLDKEGKVRLVLPNCQYFPLLFINLFYDLNKFWHWYMNLPHKKERSIHYHLFTRHLATKLAEEAGFKVFCTRGWLWSKEFELLMVK